MSKSDTREMSDSALNPEPLVFILVLNWNGYSDTTACLESLLQLSYRNRRIVVVDNGSTDGSAGRLAESFPNVEILETGANLGFAGGNNVGIRYALSQGADYIWLLNNDTIVQSDTLTEMVDAMCAVPKCGIVGSRIMHLADPKRVWFLGGTVGKYTLVTGHLLKDKSRGPYRVDFVSGCSLLISAECAAKIGLMDERYFMYYEDVDWCTRATRAGWVCVVTPKACLWHKVAASSQGNASDRSPAADYYDVRNGLYFIRSHASGWRKAIAQAFFVARVGRKLLRMFIKGESRKGQKLRAIVKGVWDYVRGRVGKGWD